MKNQSSSTHYSKIICKVKDYVKLQRQGHNVKMLVSVEGILKYEYVKYEKFSTYCLKFIIKVKDLNDRSDSNVTGQK